MNKKIKILLIIIASVLLLTCCSLGTVFVIKSKNKNNLIKETTYEVSTIINDSNEYKEYTIKINDNDVQENELVLKYTENEKESEQTLRYNKEKECFVYNFLKTDVERKISNIKIKYKNVWYNAKDITVNKVLTDSIYVPVALTTIVKFDECFVLVEAFTIESFYADVYLNDMFFKNFEFRNNSHFSIPYEENWQAKNIIALKNISFSVSGLYTDEIIEKEFELNTQTSLVYCTTLNETIYEFEETVELEMKVKKETNLKLQNVIINEKEHEVNNSYIEENFETIKLSVPVSELNKQSNKLLLTVDKINYLKETLEINEKFEIEILSSQLDFNIYTQSDAYLKNDEIIYNFHIKNPNGFVVKKIIINNEEKEINSNEKNIFYPVKTTEITTVTFDKAIFEYKEKEYVIEVNEEKNITIVEMPTSFSVSEEILTIKHENEETNYITISFDDNIMNKYVTVSYNFEGNEYTSSSFIFPDENSIYIPLEPELTEIKKYYIMINYIKLEECEVEHFLTNVEIDYYTILKYDKIKNITFSQINNETGEIELCVSSDKNILLKEITFMVYDDYGNIISEEWNVIVNYDEETKKYIITSPYMGVKVKILYVAYEKNNITYYTELPIKDEIILV